jgi:hypothetical protein
VRDFHAIPGFVQAFAYLFGDHHRSVLAPSASETDGEIAFPFVDVVG